MAEKSIYRIPSLLRDLNPDAYKPRMISIGPYHNGEEKLKQMEDLKQRCLDSFLTFLYDNEFQRSYCNNMLVAEFKREPYFLENVRRCYKEPLKSQWSDDYAFSHLMVLDGCFLLELLLNDHSENRALLSYVKLDMLVLDNQIPLLVLKKLASINKGWVVDLNWDSTDRLTFSQLIWKIYGIMPASYGYLIDDIPEHDAHHVLDVSYGYLIGDIPENDAHHVLDAYRKGCIDTGAYDGWASSLSVRELYYNGVKFRPSSSGSFRDVEFNVSDNTCIGLVDRFISCLRHQNDQNDQNGQAQSSCNKLLTWITAAIRLLILLTLIITFWWLYILVGVAKGMLYLPRLSIDGTTRPALLNLMDFERLHLPYQEPHPVTDYVLLMASLIRSEIDVEHLRKESILLCSPGWTNESVVQLFADLTRNVVFNGTRTTNPDIDALCERRPNKFWSVWRRLISPESSDVKSFVVALLTFYGLVITALSTCFTIVKYFKE